MNILQVSTFVKYQFQLVIMAASGWLSFHCPDTLACDFLTIVSTIPPFWRAILFVCKPCFLDRIRHADRAFR